MNFTLAPYTPACNGAIRQLESRITQGKGIRLKIVKDCFLSRATVFLHHNACVALDENGAVIGTAIGAETMLEVNEARFRCGVGFDVKVDPAHKNKGIGTAMAAKQKEWFAQQGLTKNFTTLKISNAPVVRLVSKAFSNVWLTPFVYLTLPISLKLPTMALPQGESRFAVRLFNAEEVLPEFYTTLPSGLGLFHTWMMYRLRIEKLSAFYQLGLPLLRRWKPKLYGGFGGKGSEMTFATLYNHTPQNIGGVAEAMEQLRKKAVPFLLVCCQKGDAVYKVLKQHSINMYGYYVMSDFSLSEKDAIGIDVRCL